MTVFTNISSVTQLQLPNLISTATTPTTTTTTTTTTTISTTTTTTTTTISTTCTSYTYESTDLLKISQLLLEIQYSLLYR